MQIIEFSFDRKAYGWGYAPTLISQDVPEYGNYYCIHDNTGMGGGEARFRVAIYDSETPEGEEFEGGEVDSKDTDDFDAVVDYLRRRGIKFDREAQPVLDFLANLKR